MLLAVTTACTPRLEPRAPVATPAGVRFMAWFPEARSVAVAGSFNQWSTSSHALLPADVDGLWTAVVPMPPGTHTFMYVVDGSGWVTPPLADDFADDGFGSRNGVIVVEPTGEGER